jgi:hypothetical protein
MTKESDKNQNPEQGNHVLQLIINDKHFEWNQEYISGAEIRNLGKIPADDEIFLSIKRPWEDEAIKDDTNVNLARPEIEHFFSKEKHFNVVLIVNLREKTWTEKRINFEQVVVLAYNVYDPNPNKVYTITFDRGPHQNPEGSMIKGDKVFVKDKMIFNVKQADKS